MSDAQLREEVLKVLAEKAVHGAGPRASELIAQARKQWNADEFEVREAIWYLLSNHQIELTPERTLRPTEAHPEQVPA